MPLRARCAVPVLSMSKQEFSRLDVLLRVQSGRLRVSDACVLIGLLGTELSGKGIATWRATFAPVPSYRVEQPEALSATQKGLAAWQTTSPRAWSATHGR
jgi:hypothetical protein